MKELIQRDWGSASIMMAFSRSVAGRARIAPSGPRIHAQNSRDRKETVGITPTDSPVNLGWMIAWMTKFSTE